MKQMRFWQQTLGILILSAFPLFARAEYSVLHYSLPWNVRMEVHFNESAGKPPVEILLFAHPYLRPTVLSITDEEWLGGESISAHQRYIFPAPDNKDEALNLPPMVGFDLVDSTTYNLRQGMLVITDYQTDNSSHQFLHIFPLAHIVKFPHDKTAYHFQEPARRKGSSAREYSLELVEDDPSSSKPEPNLLLSIQDLDRDQSHPFGTATISKGGQLQMQNEQWTDFSALGTKFQFTVATKEGGRTYKSILVDSKPWGQPVQVGDGSPYSPAPSSPSPEQIRNSRLLQRSRLEDARLEAYEPQVERESNLTQTLLKLSGIEAELTSPRFTVVSYSLRALEHPIQSKTYYVLTALVRGKKIQKLTARSWILAMDLKKGMIEKHPLPPKLTIDDLYQLPSGQIILKNGAKLDLTPHFSCSRAHPF